MTHSRYVETNIWSSTTSIKYIFFAYIFHCDAFKMKMIEIFHSSEFPPILLYSFIHIGYINEQ